MPYEMWLAEQIRRNGRGYEGGDRAFAADVVAESIAEKKFMPRRDFDNRRAAAAAFGMGWEVRLEQLARQRIAVQPRGSGNVAESADGTDASVFLAQMSSIYTAEVERGYDLAQSSVDDLLFDYPTPDRLGEITVNQELMPTDKVREVAPGQPYPVSDFEGYNITIPRPIKQGQIARVLLEHMIEGQTADRLDAAFRVGEQARLAEKKMKLKLILGVDNTYKRNGTGINTYLTAGAYVNALDDFNQANGPEEFDRLERLFDDMTDPTTGEVISLSAGDALTVYVPRSNLVQTRKNVNATELWRDNGGTPNQTTVSPNPMEGLTAPVTDRLARKLITASGVSAAIADTYCVYGYFSKAFGFRTVRPFQVLEQDSELASEVGFNQDIVYACKARTWSVPFVRNPQFVTRGRKTA